MREAKLQTLLMLQNMKGIVLKRRRQLPAVPDVNLNEEKHISHDTCDVRKKMPHACALCVLETLTQVLSVRPLVALHIE